MKGTARRNGHALGKGRSRAFLVAALVATFGFLGTTARVAQAERALKVGSKRFTESYVLAEIVAALARSEGTLVTHEQALAALFLYGLLPIVRNTHAGLASIPAPLRDAALALGLSPHERLRHVEFPLASRTILAGTKTSAVIAVGSATIAAFIGAGGFGDPISTGLSLNDVPTILTGAIPAAGMALLVQAMFALLERRALRNAEGDRTS